MAQYNALNVKLSNLQLTNQYMARILILPHPWTNFEIQKKIYQN